MAQILALIPARGGSKGLPNKNIRLLGGRPLLAHAVEAARASKLVTRVVLTTDDEKIANVGRDVGCDVPFIRPSALAADDTPMAEVVRHALTELRTAEQFTPDTVVLLQPTAPFRCGKDIDNALALLATWQFDSVVSVVKVPAHYSPPWQFVLQDNALQLYNGHPIGNIITRRQDLPSTYIRNGAIYAFRREAFELTKCLYGERCGALIMPHERAINIDTLDDWAEAERYIGQSDNADSDVSER